jgi:hypothetical protein
MPGIGVGFNSQVTTERPRSDFRHISTIRDVSPGTINTVYLDVRLENWRKGGAPEHHTFVPKILVGVGYGTTETYDSMQEWDAPDDPTGETIIRRYTFTLAAPVSSYRIRMEGTTDNILWAFHVAERIDIALTV